MRSWRRPSIVLKTARTEHGLPGLAWCLEERSRLGLFHPDRAVELGVTPGPDFGRLQRGETIVTSGGADRVPR